MPWYKFHAIHGPGHQGHTAEYLWYDHTPSKAERRELWDDWVNRERLDDAVGSVMPVKELPEPERLAQIEHYRYMCMRAQRMLELLGDSP